MGRLSEIPSGNKKPTKEEILKKKKQMESIDVNKTSSKIIIEDGTLASFGFNDGYK